MPMHEYSCLFRYGDSVIGSSGLIYFASMDKFEDWFQYSNQIQWAVLVNNETGRVMTTRSRTASELANN